MKINFETLKKAPLFNGIDSDEFLPCLRAAVGNYEKGQTVFAEGDEIKYVGVVLSGSVHIISEDFNGNRTISATAGTGDLFAEAFAFSGKKYFPVSVVAAERSEILFLDRDCLHSPCARSCRDHRTLISNLLEIIVGKNLILNKKIEVLSKRTTREKLMTYLLSEAKKAGKSSFVIPYDRQALADFLCVDRSAMSTEIGKLRKEGIIKAEKSRFTVLKEN